MDANRKTAHIKKAINDKMRVLEDFGICTRRDTDMRRKLAAAIDAKPDKDPDEVLDYFCRPMIQAVANSWI